MNVFTWFSDRNNITFLIAIAGFAMSLYNFFRALWDRRCALSIDYVNHHCSPCKGHTRFEIRMNIQNLSSAPLSIVRMYIICDGKSYSFAFPAQEVMEFTHTKGGIETRHSEVLSQTFRQNSKASWKENANFNWPCKRRKSVLSLTLMRIIPVWILKSTVSLPMLNNLSQNIENDGTDCQNQRPVLEGHSIHHPSPQSSALNWPPVL